MTVALLAAVRLGFSDAHPAELWRPAAPESAGFSSAKLEALRANLADRGTKAFLVIRRDTVVCEWYAPEHAAEKTHYTASLAKALFGGLSLAVALSDGRLTLDDPAARYLPPWRSDSRKSRITLRHLGSHTAGIEDAEADGLPHEKLTGWKGDFWKRRPVPEDPFTLARDRAPALFEPGERMHYSNPGIALLTWCVTAALRDAPQPDIRSLLRERIMRPLGIPDAEWSAGYGQTFTVDGLPLVPSWGGGACTARAAARVGRLMLREGDWEGQRLLSAEAVRLTTADAGTPGPCGIGWWSNQEGDCEALPRDAFFGSGAGHQILLVVPSLDLVVVRFGSLLDQVESEPQSFHRAYCRHLFEPLMAALTARREAGARLSLQDGRWLINDRPTNAGSAAEGLLMNVRMVNAVFEDRARPDFDPEANTARFLARLPDYATAGVNAFTICLQGGMPGYEGAVNSAFEPDGSLRPAYLARVERVIRACGREGLAVILGLFYQRQSAILRDETAVRAGVANAAGWVRDRGFQNVVLEIANEYPHGGFVHAVIRDPRSQAGLIRLAKATAPHLLVSASGCGDGAVHPEVAEAADFLLPHWNDTREEEIPARLQALRQFGKAIVCNEDDKTGTAAVAALRASVANGAGYGLMLKERNQTFPFHFEGPADDPVFYAALREVTSPARPAAAPFLGEDYFPPPESQGGWRKLEEPEPIRRLAGMDPARLEDLRQWLLQSDQRGFAAVVIRRGYIVLEVERGNSAKTDSRRVASVSKAVCATVLAIAAEQSQQGRLPRRMTFDDPAFGFIPWAEPLSDPRKARITVRQLLNHTSGVCPEATGAPNDGSWEYILGHTGDARTAQLAFDPGTGCGYSTHAFAHAALVCETVTGKPYDTFAIDALFRPLGIEHWWFQYYDGGKGIGRHPSHGLGLPARDLARIAYCLLQGGRWGEQQVVPAWFVAETAAPTHEVNTPEMRWQLNPQVFSHGWELPARHRGQGGRSGEGIPADARSKPGSGGQLIAFVPSLDLVVTRQTGSSGDWAYEEYLRRACAAVLPGSAR